MSSSVTFSAVLLLMASVAIAGGIFRKRYDRLLQWNPLDPEGLDYDNSAPDLMGQHSRYVRKKAITQHPLCPPTEPFLCPGDPKKCISIGFICDGSRDCPDGYDEDKAVCAAKNRPPVRDTVTVLNNLLKQHGANFLEKFFGSDGKDGLGKMGGVERVAEQLSQSPTIDDFATATKMEPANRERFRQILLAMEKGNLDELQLLGLTETDLRATKFFLDKIIATGFVSK